VDAHPTTAWLSERFLPLKQISPSHNRIAWIGAGVMLRFTLFLSLPLGGCMGGPAFDRDTMRAAFDRAETPSAEHRSAVTHAEIQTLAHPLRLALYFVERDMPLSHKIRKAEWISQDKAALIHELTPLLNEGIVTDAFLLADSTIRGHDVPKIRQTAARYRADAVLIVEGIGAVDRYNNGYAMWYATLIGAYFAPGTVSEALFMINGSLWETRTDRLYTTTLTAEGRSKSVGSAALIEDDQVLAQAKAAALAEIGKRAVDELRRLRTPPPASDRSR
jgi:hypothetical protein